jgi:hypothetical protein
MALAPDPKRLRLGSAAAVVIDLERNRFRLNQSELRISL